MKARAIVATLGPIDLRSIGRDSFLTWMLPLPLVMAAILRYGVPALALRLESEIGFDLRPYYPLVTAYFAVLFAPLLVGMLVGFVLLDERDDETLKALLVTPLPLEQYLAYRIGVPLLLCTAVTMAAVPLLDLAPVAWSRVLPIAGVAALEGPILALALAAIAENKVQGFALLKGISALQMIPIAAYFVDPPLQFAAGLWPSYWPAKAYWLAEAGDPATLWVVAIGFAIHLGLLGWLLQRFRRVVHRA